MALSGAKSFVVKQAGLARNALRPIAQKARVLTLEAGVSEGADIVRVRALVLVAAVAEVVVRSVADCG